MNFEKFILIDNIAKINIPSGDLFIFNATSERLNKTKSYRIRYTKYNEKINTNLG